VGESSDETTVLLHRTGWAGECSGYVRRGSYVASDVVNVKEASVDSPLERTGR